MTENISQEDILDFIINYYQEHGKNPTIKTISNSLCIPQNDIKSYLISFRFNLDIKSTHPTFINTYLDSAISDIEDKIKSQIEFINQASSRLENLFGCLTHYRSLKDIN